MAQFAPAQPEKWHNLLRQKTTKVAQLAPARVAHVELESVAQLAPDYAQTAKLLNRLKLSKLDASYLKELKKLESLDLLILDDFGLQALDIVMREALLNIVQDRHQKKSTIIVSQIPVKKWYDLICIFRQL